MPSSTKEMLLTLLEKVRSGSYPAPLLDSPDELARKIALDLGCDQSKAMSLLGYLLEYKHIRLDAEKGVVLTVH